MNSAQGTSIVVVGVDGSETASRAARTAADLARARGGALHVVSAYGQRGEVQTVKAEGEEVVLRHLEIAETDAQQEVAALRREYPDLELVAAAADGKPAEALVKYAETVDAGVIVVGNKRVQGLARLLGSVAADVAHKAHCDVYIAHTKH